MLYPFLQTLLRSNKMLLFVISNRDHLACMDALREILCFRLLHDRILIMP